MTDKEIVFVALFEEWANEKITGIAQLPVSGSGREYYRITGTTKTAIAAYNADIKENLAFIDFSNNFEIINLSVPRILNISEDKTIYLQSDLGDLTLYQYLSNLRENQYFPKELIDLYKKVINELIKFQVLGAKQVDFSVCYPRHSFDSQSIHWDTNYFKYYFLKLANISFDEQALEIDFEHFTNFLLENDNEYFMYRDFQSRNIMLVNNQPYFIDYQGGRKGALQYDIASLLYDAKADIPEEIRIELLNFYITNLKLFIAVDNELFIKKYYAYVLIRIMQALGAYGYRGFYQRKEHFLQSIPFAIENLKYLILNNKIPSGLPHLKEVLIKITDNKELIEISKKSVKLKISINSFAYKNGLPYDNTGNGGGFIFDCRGIPNPGKFEKYRNQSGLDQEVITFLEGEPEVKNFLSNIYSIVNQSVESYIKKGFGNLMINFGCTGGQHRSVFSAERLKKQLEEKYSQIEISLYHRELNIRK